MRALLTGLAVGLMLGVFIGVYFARFPEAVRATAIGLGAGAGIFALGALVRFVAGLADKTFSTFKEKQQA